MDEREADIPVIPTDDELGKLVMVIRDGAIIKED